MSARTWQLIWVALVVTVVMVWLRSSATPVPVAAAPPGGVDTDAQLAPLATIPSTAATIVVHVSGAVADPGLVRLAATSRVADAVAAAGGFAPVADTRSVNLAAGLMDGIQVHIPRTGEQSPRAAVGGGASEDKVAVNQATVEDLQRLPGVGPVLAGRILDYRNAHGPFLVVEDLLDVPGIGEGRLAELRDQIVIP